MKTSITPHLGYRPDNGGRYALVIQVIHNRRRSILTMPYRLLPDEFSLKKGVAVPNSRKQAHMAFIREVNSCIRNTIEELHAIEKRFQQQGIPYTAGEITGMHRHCNNYHYLLTFADKLISDLEARNHFGTARSYRSLASAWRKFAGKNSYRFRQLDNRLVTTFIDHLERNGNKRNTINFYTRTLRALYRRACKHGYACTNQNPFKEVSFKVAKTPKLAVDRQLLRTLASSDFENALLNEARDMFLFSFYARGMSFVDMTYLKKKNVWNGALHYERQKTHQLFNVAVTPQLQQIMTRYDNPASPWVLPCMKRGMLFSSTSEQEPVTYTCLTPAEQYKSYRQSLQFYIQLLRKISDRLRCRNLTFNVARHTWATEARSMGVPMPHISEGLGHTSEKTTRFYLAQLDNSTVDKINEQVTKLHE